MSRSTLQRGFTLMETLTVVGIVSLIVIALFNIYEGYGTVFVIQQARVDVNGSAREIADEFKKTVLQASRVVASHDFSGVTHTSGNAVAVFEVPSVNSTGDIIAGTYDYVAFYATSADAYKVTDGASGSVRASSTKHLSKTLSALAFTYNNSTITLATSTTIEIQTQTTAKDQTISAHIYETARLRNNI